MSNIGSEEERILTQAAAIIAQRQREVGSFISNMIRSAAHRSRQREARDNRTLIFGNPAQITARRRRRLQEIQAAEDKKNETGK